MATVTRPSGPASRSLPGSGRRSSGARRSRPRAWWPSWRRRVLPSQGFLLLVFILLTLLWALGRTYVPTWVPFTGAVPVLMLGGFFLRLRALVMLYVVVASVTVYVSVSTSTGRVTPGQVLVLVLTGVMVMAYARSRERLGVQGNLGQSMLVDLRDRLRAHSEVPDLPQGWSVETELRPAYGDSFSGDFLITSCSTDGRWLELALVDVSGKGQAAGTRALLLSGALGGLLGAMARAEFLPAANGYLLRQGWDEGFATAVHLAVDLSSGQFQLSSAGHPPPAHFHAGSGDWELLDGQHGPALGIVPEATFPAHTGALAPGDALLLYTDGLVETPGGDLALGIDRLMGQAERQVQAGFRGGAARIVDGTGAGENDDRALVMLWRG